MAPILMAALNILYCAGGPGFEVSLPGSSGYSGEVAPCHYCSYEIVHNDSLGRYMKKDIK